MTTVAPEVAERAGARAAAELVESAVVLDLRDEVPAPLHAGGPGAGPLRELGCPCGCGETELLQRARAGDDDAVEALLARYRGLARRRAGAYFLLGGDREDIAQEAMIGLYGAIRDFDEARGVPFGAFADVCVTRQVLSAVKAATRYKHGPLNRAVSLDTPTGPDTHVTLADLVPAAQEADPAAAVMSAEQIRALRDHLVLVLSDLERQVLRHHVEGKTYSEIAALLQRHAKSVDNALQRIKRKVQEHLDARDE